MIDNETIKRVVVYGGSFNPPTKAHILIMQSALDAVNADRGYFVPVSFPYLKRKMVKAGQSHLCLSDELRLRLLETTIANDERVQIYTDVMGEPFSDDVGNMNRIQQQYPKADIYYVAGADKLDLLDHFAKKGDFLNRFRCILYARDSDRLMEEIAAHEHLKAHQDAFVPVAPPEGIEGVSSTKIREHLFDVETVADMLYPAVVPMLRELKATDYPKEIIQFKDAYGFLSNDDHSPLTVEGITYPCVTSAFAASKWENPAERKTIAGMKLKKVKQKFNTKESSPVWEEQKTEIMEALIRMKFRQHPELAEKLAATGECRLINGGKKDAFWGVNLITWEGDNRLGLILMKIRKEIMEEKAK